MAKSLYNQYAALGSAANPIKAGAGVVVTPGSAANPIRAGQGTVVTPGSANYGKPASSAPVNQPVYSAPAASPAPAPAASGSGAPNGGIDLNQLEYLKKTAEAAKAAGNKGLYNWAAGQAQTMYKGSTSQDLAKQFQSMNASALNAYRNPVTGKVEEAPKTVIGDPAVQEEVPVDPAQQPDDMTAQLMQMFQELMGQQDQNQVPAWQQDWAAQQAQSQAAQERSNIESLLGQLKSGQQLELDQIQNNLNQGKTALEDKTFQNWLASRQDVANRGLGGSGIANDTDTRLLLANGRELAGLTGQANTNLGEVSRRYGGQLSEAFSRLSQVNPALMQSTLMQQLFKDSSASMTDRAKIVSDMLGQFLPYDRVKPFDAMQLSTQDRQFYDKLGSDEKMQYEKMASDERQTYTSLSSQEKQTYAKLNSDDRKFYANLRQEDRQFYDKLATDTRINLAQIMGVDPITGQPTIDTAKLNETIRNNNMQINLNYDQLGAQATQWAAQNRIDQNRIDFGYTELAAKSENDKAMLDKASAAAQNSNDKVLLDGLKAKLTSVDGQLKTLIGKNGKLDPKNPAQKALIEDRNQTMLAINSMLGLGE